MRNNNVSDEDLKSNNVLRETDVVLKKEGMVNLSCTAIAQRIPLANFKGHTCA